MVGSVIGIASIKIDLALPVIAAQSQEYLPMRVDAVTRLVSIEAVDGHLQRTYEISRDGFRFDDRFAAMIGTNICNNALLAQLLQAGVTIDEIYVRTDGTQIGRQAISQDACQGR